jgi:hypothetical protein
VQARAAGGEVPSARAGCWSGGIACRCGIGDRLREVARGQLGWCGALAGLARPERWIWALAAGGILGLGPGLPPGISVQMKGDACPAQRGLSGMVVAGVLPHGTEQQQCVPCDPDVALDEFVDRGFKLPGDA